MSDCSSDLGERPPQQDDKDVSLDDIDVDRHTASHNGAHEPQEEAEEQQAPSPVSAAAAVSSSWRGVAVVAGLPSFESDWKPQLDHVEQDVSLVSETFHAMGYNVVLDLFNKKMITPNGTAPCEAGQLSWWELQERIRYGYSLVGDGVLTVYLSTWGGWSKDAPATNAPDSFCTFEQGGIVKLEELLRVMGFMAATDSNRAKTVIILDLAVPKQMNQSTLPNLYTVIPSSMGLLLSLTPTDAKIFTPKLLQTLYGLALSPGEMGVTLEALAYSPTLTDDLVEVAEACRRTNPRGWDHGQWYATTVARSLQDPVMTTPLAAAELPAARLFRVLVSYTRTIEDQADNLPLLYERMEGIRGLLTSCRDMRYQPLQSVIVCQTSATPLKAWEIFRAAFSLTTSELQKVDKKDSSLGFNNMAVYIKFGASHPNPQGEVEVQKLEQLYLRVRQLGKDFYFGTDPKAGLTKEENIESTEQPCKVKTIAMRLEAQYSCTALDFAKLIIEARLPVGTGAIKDSAKDQIEVHKLQTELRPDQTYVRYSEDVAYNKVQQSRTRTATSMNTDRAAACSEHGITKEANKHVVWTSFLNISEASATEAAIRVQSIFRMYQVRRAYVSIMWQLGEKPLPGPEMRRKVRLWLLAASHYLRWVPMSPRVVCTVDASNSDPNTSSSTSIPSHHDIVFWAEKRKRLESDFTKKIASSLGLSEDRVQLDGLNGVVGRTLSVGIRVLSTWVGPGDEIPEREKRELDTLASKVADLINSPGQNFKQLYFITRAEVSHKLMPTRQGSSRPGTDLRYLTPGDAIRTVLTGKTNDSTTLPAVVRRCLEEGLQAGNPIAAILQVLVDPAMQLPLGWQRKLLEIPLLPGRAQCRLTSDITQEVRGALADSPDMKERARRMAELMEVSEVFSIAKLRGDKKEVYEIPGIRQLDKTPMIMYSRYWADRDYYDDLPDFFELHEEERIKLLLPTVRRRREAKTRRYVGLVEGYHLTLNEMGRCKTFTLMLVSFALLLITGYMIFLLPKWCSNVTALIYLNDMTELSLEMMVTWILIYMVALMGAFFVSGGIIMYIRQRMTFKLRTRIIFICAKYSRMLTSDMVNELKHEDLRHAMGMVFETIPKIVIGLFVLFASLITIFVTSAQLGLICLGYLILRFLLHVSYDSFMIRHMTAISNIEAEEQAKWVLLKGPAGAAGHVTVQAADDHQMRLCLYAREKREINTENMVVHTAASVTDWILLLTLPAFFLYVGAWQVAKPGKSGEQMAQQVEDLTYCFYYYVLLLLAWSVTLRGTVSLVERRPNITRLLTVLKHIQLTDSEKGQITRLLNMRDDRELAEQLNIRRDTATQNGVAGGDQPRSEMTVQDVKKRMLLKFDWLEALIQAHPMSTVLLYLCFLFWVIFIFCFILFAATSWESECRTTRARCFVRDTDIETPDRISMPQTGDMFGRCTLQHPIAYSLRLCALELKGLLGNSGGSVNFTAALEYDTWQSGRVGFSKKFQFKAGDRDPCPTDGSPWVHYRVIDRLRIEDEQPLEDTFHNVCFPDSNPNDAFNK